MTVSSLQTRQVYVGDNVSTVFPIPFPFFDATDLLVYLGGAMIATGYTVSGGGGGTGSLTMATPPATGVWLQIVLNDPLTQTVDLVDGTAFPSDTLNEVHDRSVQIDQRTRELIGRSISAPDSDVTPSMQLPAASLRANTVVGFDSNGNLSLVQSIPAGTLSAAVVGGFLYPPSGVEAGLGISPTNLIYPEGTVDRYGTNVTPGTTDMSAAFQTAINVACATTGLGYAGARVRFLRGAYRIQTPPTLPSTTNELSLDIGGVGYGTQIINAAAASHPTLSGRSGVYVHDLLFSGLDSNPNDGITFSNTGLQTQRWRIERCVFFMAGRGVVGHDTNTAVIRDCLFWPDDGASLCTVAPPSTLSAVGHHMYFTGSFAHDIQIVNCDANVRSSFATNQRGIKFDASFAYGCIIQGGSVASSSGLGLTSLDIANWNSGTIIGLNSENASSAFTNCTNSTVIGLNNLQTTGGVTITSNSVDNTFIGLQMASISFDASSTANTVIGGSISTWTDSASPQNVNLNLATTARGPALGLHVQKSVAAGSGGTITPDMRVADFYDIAVAGAGAFNFTIANPTNLVHGQILYILLRNTAGSAWTGTLTWGSAYRVASFTNLTNGQQRVYGFQYDSVSGTLRQLSAAVDVAV